MVVENNASSCPVHLCVMSYSDMKYQWAKFHGTYETSLLSVVPASIFDLLLASAAKTIIVTLRNETYYTSQILLDNMKLCKIQRK